MLAWLAIGCGGYSYVYRSPVERPLEGVRRIGVRLEACVPHVEDALAQRLISREDALVDWLGREGRAASFARLEGGEDATMHVVVTVEPRSARPDPRLVITDAAARRSTRPRTPASPPNATAEAGRHRRDAADARETRRGIVSLGGRQAFIRTTLGGEPWMNDQMQTSAPTTGPQRNG